MKSSKRIRSLDILRGLAILGTLGTNIWIFAHLGDLNYIFTFTHNKWWLSGDAFLRTLFLALINGKLLGLLAIMFGVGLELKYQQSQRLNRPWPGIYIWISLILLLEGFLHFTLVLEYDILMSYAMTAIIVSLIVKAGEKTMRITMISAAVIHVFFILIVCLGVLVHQVNSESFATPQEITNLYQIGSWLEQVQYRLSHFWDLRTEAIFVIPFNIFLFLTGVLLMRKGAFTNDDNGRNIRKKMMKIGLSFGLPLNLLLFIPGGYFDFPVRYIFAPILSMGYMGAISLLVEKFHSFSLWRFLERAGKMSLSCYVLQNILCSVLFYGWGLGFGGNPSSFTVISVWILICLLQLFFATLWLGYFTMGPMETARKHLADLLIRKKTSRKDLQA
ncbi:DUF418 domain-containing protein [Bacillus sp. CGMCC 1.60114]|uniref:DUF418 domain-containing protein n=1 Tax=unclassified Bacillus (in: firmicutes) TaxID=185979 RepID=UPI0036328E96